MVVVRVRKQPKEKTMNGACEDPPGTRHALCVVILAPYANACPNTQSTTAL